MLPAPAHLRSAGLSQRCRRKMRSRRRMRFVRGFSEKKDETHQKFDRTTMSLL